MTSPVAYGDLSQLAGNLAQASGNSFDNVASQLIRQTAAQIAEDAKGRAPRKTGALAASITVTFMGPLTALIGPTKKYGVFQEYGTATRGEFPGPMYWIYPVRASRLVFEIDGKKIFAKKVHHPGIPPHPYMRPAVKDVLQNLQDKLGETGVKLIVSGRG